jgi:subtilisin family serine protease
LIFRTNRIGLVSGEGDQLKRLHKLIFLQGAKEITAVTEEKVIVPAGTSTTLPTPDDLERWGLQTTGALTSKYTGAGVKVGFADTGLDLDHPDFKTRVDATFSAIPQVPPQDGNGHGTECAGIACGPMNPLSVPRYGVAVNARIIVAKVINDAGIGAQGWVVDGCNRAVANGCRVICLALQDTVMQGQLPDPVYETLGRTCLEQGTLLIAAAGNDSNRSIGNQRPVASPANCVSILGVGAVGSRNGQIEIAEFSNIGGLNGAGSDVDIAAPGVQVASSALGGYGCFSGTSHAAAFVAGIAALLFEANPTLSAADVQRLLLQNAQKLGLLPADVGAGLAQAPQ